MAPPAIVATPGSATANSYITLAEAEVYISSRLSVTGWPTALSANDTKIAAILWATRILDGVCWRGMAASADQALAWPRSGVYRHGHVLDTDVIPTELKNATAELARQLILSDLTADSDTQSQGISRIKAGPVELQFRDDFVKKHLPDAVLMLLPQSFICDNWKNSIEIHEEPNMYYFDVMTDDQDSTD